ncbi:hypothetical protein CAOG_05769 [Capsaspora owczarzaki ATCC 30864]|uniref:DUF202 domain-containing protein n=1 Tax=Capsaspora owczarzaki (strain ATCC 30864) TaxID=595528 RepID=A0A0D2VV46_CAPO3|nr:hypothetical protein CAOG_05769 [Capsaspora owczarzaki ATCC 30864]KJE95307.1 hypothetical protein CAOG_005769 [Capsaspora owczarzaki ATCC 30864]|eukprot:XP_004346442.1 hypothetical protein CAOG_05769 [Capsaspora owczarzaki ATCC 30864]
MSKPILQFVNDDDRADDDDDAGFGAFASASSGARRPVASTAMSSATSSQSTGLWPSQRSAMPNAFELLSANSASSPSGTQLTLAASATENSEDRPTKLKKKLKKQIKKSIKAYRGMNKPKMFLANERTYLRWIGQTLALGSMGTTVVVFMNDEMRVPGYLMWAAALGFLVYATIKFRRRAHALAQQRPSPDYDAPIGPVAFMGCVMVAVLAYIIALIVHRS